MGELWMEGALLGVEAPPRPPSRSPRGLGSRLTETSCYMKTKFEQKKSLGERPQL